MDERKLRNFIVRVLKENEGGDSGFSYDPYDYMGYGGGGDYGGGGGGSGSGGRFMGPIMDTVKAFGLAGKDIINSTKLIVKSLYTFSPEKLKKARDEYNQRKNQIAQEWSPILKSTASAIENSDLGVVTFALAPNIFFAMHMAKFAKGAPMAVGDYLYKAGLIPSLPDSWQKRLDRSYFSSDSKWEEFKRSGDRERSGSTSSKNSISDRIRVFFFGESHARDLENLLFEEDEKQFGGRSLDDLFTPDLTEEIRDQLLDAKRRLAKKILEDVALQVQKLNDESSIKAEIDDALKKAEEKVQKKRDSASKRAPAGNEEEEKNKRVELLRSSILKNREQGIDNLIKSSIPAVFEGLSGDMRNLPDNVKGSLGGREFAAEVTKIAEETTDEIRKLAKSPTAAAKK